MNLDLLIKKFKIREMSAGAAGRLMRMDVDNKKRNLRRKADEIVPCKLKESFLVRKPNLLTNHHFEFSPQLLIYDHDTFTLGFVVDGVTPGLSVKNGIKKAVEEAVYVFHQLYTHAQPLDFSSASYRVPNVELSLIFENNFPEIALKEALQELAKETNLMHAIGVGILIINSQEGDIAEIDFRRAFPWLLKDTKNWYDGDGKINECQLATSLTALQLDAYRLGYPLKIEFGFQDAKYPIHLVHGHNGTGKSTLTEAFELMLTGRIDRLGLNGNPSRYIAAIRNRYAKNRKPQITINPDNIDKVIWDLSAENPFTQKKEPLRTAASFRLDQPVMTQLTGRSNGKRANLFLSAFFGDQEVKINSMNETKRARDGALSELGKAFPGKWGLGRAKEEFAWLFEEPLRPTLDSVKSLLPIPWEHLERVANRLPVLARLPEVTRETLGTLLEELDGQVLQLMETGISSNLNVALGALSKLKPWQPASGSARTNRQEALDRWLESLAYADLADRQASILQTQRRALELVWRDPESFFKTQSSPAEVENAVLQKKDRFVRRDRAYSEMEQAFQQETGTPAGTAKSVNQIALTRFEIDALNQVGPWIISGYTDLNFGSLCSNAVAQGQFKSAGAVVIGETGWVESLLNTIKTLNETFDQLSLARKLELWQSAKRFRVLQDIKEKNEEHNKAQKEVKKLFLDKVASMTGPLNELMALFTPARWAYHDLKLKYKPDGQNQSMRLDDEDDEGAKGADAALRLNTAELNLFTVALFLLCAPRIDNAFKVLILDDPLQNMDEMTATSFARGLNQLVPFFPKGWNLIFLFHGEDDMERFCQQLPEAAQYRLPWLSPQKAYDDTLVIVDRKQTNHERLAIGEVIEFVL